VASLVLWFLRLFSTFRQLEAEHQELTRRVLILGVGAYGIESPNGTARRVEGEVLKTLMQHTPAHIVVSIAGSTVTHDDVPANELRVQLILGGGR
jgi:hypothetical protein